MPSVGVARGSVGGCGEGRGMADAMATLLGRASPWTRRCCWCSLASLTTSSILQEENESQYSAADVW